MELNKNNNPDFKKLEWTGSSTALYWIFWQLKNSEPKSITGTYEDIALIIKQSFTTFEDVSISTIVQGLKRGKAPKENNFTFDTKKVIKSSNAKILKNKHNDLKDA